MWIAPLLLVLAIYAYAVAQTPEILLYGGVFCVVIGFLAGIPTALLYHFRLFRLVYPVAPKELLGSKWWVDPRKLYPYVTEKEIPSLDVLFRLMIREWWIAMGGCLLVFLWLLLSFFRA